MSLRNNIMIDKLWTLQYVCFPDKSYHSSKNILSFHLCRSTIYVTNTGNLNNLSVFFFLSNTTTTKYIPQAEPKKLLLPPCP